MQNNDTHNQAINRKHASKKLAILMSNNNYQQKGSLFKEVNFMLEINFAQNFFVKVANIYFRKLFLTSTTVGIFL